MRFNVLEAGQARQAGGWRLFYGGTVLEGITTAFPHLLRDFLTQLKMQYTPEFAFRLFLHWGQPNCTCLAWIRHKIIRSMRLQYILKVDNAQVQPSWEVMHRRDVWPPKSRHICHSPFTPKQQRVRSARAISWLKKTTPPGSISSVWFFPD